MIVRSKGKCKKNLKGNHEKLFVAAETPPNEKSPRSRVVIARERFELGASAGEQDSCHGYARIADRVRIHADTVLRKGKIMLKTMLFLAAVLVPPTTDRA